MNWDEKKICFRRFRQTVDSPDDVEEVTETTNADVSPDQSRRFKPLRSSIGKWIWLPIKHRSSCLTGTPKVKVTETRLWELNGSDVESSIDLTSKTETSFNCRMVNPESWLICCCRLTFKKDLLKPVRLKRWRRKKNF